jgi:hypothetical protein
MLSSTCPARMSIIYRTWSPEYLEAWILAYARWPLERGITERERRRRLRWLEAALRVSDARRD